MITLSGFLRNNKTYLIAVAIGLLAVARQLDWIDQNAYEVLLGLLGASGMATLRMSVAKVSNDLVSAGVIKKD